MKALDWFGLGLLFAAFLVLVSGCAFDAATIEALSRDNATFCARISSIYGVVAVSRTNITTGTVKCDGLEVYSPGDVVVPVTVKAVPTP